MGSHIIKYTDAKALAAAVQAGAITDGVTKAPTHDAVFDVKATADTALTPAEHTTIGNNAPHHAESHSIASHNDTTGTGAELEELTDGSETTLHSHAGDGGELKVKLETRVLNAADGDVSYTGYGFQPSGLIIITREPAAISIGSSEPALAEHCFFIKSIPAITPGQSANIVDLGPGTGYFMRAVVKTYDVDGFTLTWTKTGDDTATALLHVFAFK